MSFKSIRPRSVGLPTEQARTGARQWLARIPGVGGRLGQKPKVAFVLSGGGNLGAVQVGMLRALAEAGVKPDMIIGCSVGAINGAAFAAEPNLRGVTRLDRIWRRMAEGDPDLMPAPRLMPLVAQLARKGESLHEQDRLEQLLDEELPTKSFDTLAVPFACVATDVDATDEYWFESGRLVPALLASAALPAVYPAVEHQGRSLIDGGVLNEIHTHKAMAMGATVFYILHVGHLEERTFEVTRPFDAAVRAYWTARRFRLEDDLRQVPDHLTIHRLPAGSSPRMRFDDFSRGPELAELAYLATAEYLQTGSSPAPVPGPVSNPSEEELDEQQAAAAEMDHAEAELDVDGTARPGSFDDGELRWPTTESGAGAGRSGHGSASGDGGEEDELRSPQTQ